MKPSILIIYTGGTIGMKPDPTTGALVPFDFSGIFEEFPTLQSLNIGIEVFTMDPVIDSSNVSPRNWLDLAAIIRDNYARYDGFVVLHGTDTMSYTASALSFLLENLAKPVVFTGSQIPIGVLRTDGRENLITAIEIAGARIGDRPEVPEVSLYFQNRLFRANRTTKRSAEALSAFRSYNYPPLAEVGVNIAYNLPAILQPEESPAELRIAKRVFNQIDDMNRDTLKVMRQTEDPYYKELAEKIRLFYTPKIERLQNEFLTGRITWAAYNAQRKAMNDEFTSSEDVSEWIEEEL